MPRSANGKRKPEVFSVCDECGMFFGRKYELIRHADLHDPNVNKKKYLCPYDGCQHATLQRSNLKTHIDAKHTGIKAHQCRYESCDVAFADPGYRLRHEKKYHNYRHKTDAGNVFVKNSSMANAQVWMTPNVKIEEVPVVLDPISGPAGPIARHSQQLYHTLKPPGRAQISIHEAALDDLRLRDLQQGSRVFKDVAYIPAFHPVQQSPTQSLFSSRNVLLLARHPDDKE